MRDFILQYFSYNMLQFVMDMDCLYVSIYQFLNVGNKSPFLELRPKSI